MYKIIQLISIVFITKACPLLWKYMFIRWTWWKIILYKNFKIFWKFERKGCKEKDLFFKPFDQKIMFNGFKMFSLRYEVTCVGGNNLAKKHICLSIETHFGIFCIFSYKSKYSCTIMYEFHMNYLKLYYSFFHLNLF